MSFLLNGLYLLLLIFVSPWLLWRSWKHGRYRHGWSNRLFGLRYFPQLTQNTTTQSATACEQAVLFSKHTVWLHAVSVGEVQVLRTLVEKFELERPEVRLAISVTTDSGMELAKRIFTKHFLFFTPFDFTWSIKKTLRTLQPKLIVLAELEIWPNWLLHAEKIGCPVFIVNGRLSERSFNGYARIPYLVRACVQTIDWVGAQSETYAKRFEKLGVPASRITVTGNVKFDGASGDRLAPEVIARRLYLGLPSRIPEQNEPQTPLVPTITLPLGGSSEARGGELPVSILQFSSPSPASGRPAQREGDLGSSDDCRLCPTIFLAGSTQSPEESIVLGAFTALAVRFTNLKLILVPRHPERFEEVAELIKSTGFPWARRSASPTSVSDPNWRIFLGDSIGELRWWWGLADIGFVGGSFGDRGGQNMIEPCAYGVATCFGPNTRNFADIVRLLLDEEACTQLQTPKELQKWIATQLVDVGNRQSMANKAIALCKEHRGATQRTWEKVRSLGF